MARKPQLTDAGMEQVAAIYRAEGFTANVTANKRHVIAIKLPAWATPEVLAQMKERAAQ